MPLALLVSTFYNESELVGVFPKYYIHWCCHVTIGELYILCVPRCGCSRVPSPPRSLWRVIGCLGSCNKSVTVIWNFQFSVNIDSWCHKILNIPSIAASVSTSPGETVVIVKNNSSLKTVKYISLAPDLEDWFASWLLSGRRRTYRS